MSESNPSDAVADTGASTDSCAQQLQPTQEVFAQACIADAELALACRHWDGGIRLEIGEHSLGFTVVSGEVTAAAPDASDAAVITVTGSQTDWAPLLVSPQPRFGRLAPMTLIGALNASAPDPLTQWQYLPALERAAEILREVANPLSPSDNDDQPRADDDQPEAVTATAAPSTSTAYHDSPLGRYVHVELADSSGRSTDYRLYYEEAGSGIPLLAQHTAGAQSLQWRHLFECSEITDRFRLIAYDLPHHGKSLPPPGLPWWGEEYLLEGAFLRQVPLALSNALNLERPVFIGCSVGGLLALDLALNHPEKFQAVISIGGALHVGGDWEGFSAAWHPSVGSGAKARLMESLCGPDAPTEYVKEVSHVYSAAWPPVFRGDLHYYMVEYDLRETAHQIDTSQVGVHILSGEYDWSGSTELGHQAHEAIAGSTFAEMTGVGHFAMQENPEAFLKYLLGVLDQIQARAGETA